VDKKGFLIDFRHLETFCRVADLKSFTKAASDLFLTQPTVSGHILALEQSLSLRLFDRLAREACLTKAGVIFHQYAAKILTSRRDLLNALSEFSQGIRGELSLAASTIPGEYLLPRLISGFKKEHPNSTFSLKIGDTKEVVRLMLEGMVELGMTGARLDHPSLRYDGYEEDEIIIVGPPGYLPARKRRERFEDLSREPWIVREEGSGTQMAVENGLRKRGWTLKQLNVVMEMGSTSSVKEGVKAGLGLAFISRKAAEEELNQGSLFRIDAEGIEPIVRQIYVLSHQGKTLSPMGKEFLRFLKRNKEGIN